MKFATIDRIVSRSVLSIFAVLSVAAIVTLATQRASRSDDYDALTTAHQPLVMVAGQTRQIGSTDYLSVPGGITVNGTPSTGAGDLEVTTINGATPGTGTVTGTGTTNTMMEWSNGTGGAKDSNVTEDGTNFKIATNKLTLRESDGYLLIGGNFDGGGYIGANGTVYASTKVMLHPLFTSLDFDYATNAPVTGHINAVGYNESTGVARSTEIDDGQGTGASHLILTMDGTTRNSEFSSDVTVDGRLSTLSTLTAGTNATVGNAAGRRRTLNMSTPSSVSHGSLAADASFSIGEIFSIGTNTSVVLTISGGAQAKNCVATAIAGTYVSPGYTIIPDTSVANQITFSCLNGTTLANCPDFSYMCWY